MVPTLAGDPQFVGVSIWILCATTQVPPLAFFPAKRTGDLEDEETRLLLSGLVVLFSVGSASMTPDGFV